jgi:hypothetical protein
LLSCAALGQNNHSARQTQSGAELVKEPFIVPPHGFVSKTFSVPSGCSNALVDGRFTAKGGAKNDIEVYILDEDGFVNFRNRNRTVRYYNSGRVTQATLNVSLPSGRTYHLIFDNRFSLVSNKALSAKISTRYSCTN